MALKHNERRKNVAGILVIGGLYPAAKSVEFWSTADAEQGTCTLSDYPRNMKYGPTVNLVSGRLVACEDKKCEIYQNGTWQHLQNTIHRREEHSSVATEDAVLLIGGAHSRTTEWIPVDGSPARQAFSVRHGQNHCTLKISADVIVVTGGPRVRSNGSPIEDTTDDMVTQYQLSDGEETLLTSMGQSRARHACGLYLDKDNQQVSKVFCSIFCFKLFKY